MMHSTRPQEIEYYIIMYQLMKGSRGAGVVDVA